MSGTQSVIIAVGSIGGLALLVLAVRLRYRPQHRVRLRPEPARVIVAEAMTATVPVKAVSGAPPWDGLPDWAAPEAHRDTSYGYVSGSMGAGDGGGWREQIEADLGPGALDEEENPWPGIALVTAGLIVADRMAHSDLGPRARAVLDQYEAARRERANGLSWACAQWAAAA